MSRRTLGPARAVWLTLAALVALMLGLAACGEDSGDGGGEAQSSVGEGEGELNLVAWAGYVEDGSTDPKVDWVTPFEKQTGCDVNVKVGATSDEMVQLMRTGQYDGVSASGDASARLVEGGDVSPVNTDLVPNYEDVFDGLKDQPYNTFDDQAYGIPHGRGANVLLYNKNDVKPAPTSWDVVFDGSSDYAGSVTAYDNPIYIADAAVYLKTHEPELGITDPYELDQEQFDAAIELLKAQRENVGEYWSDALKEISAFENGDTVVGQGWQYQASSLEKADVGSVLPDEGSTGWSDTWMLSSEAEHPNCMYEWMDYVISPKVNAEIAEYFGEAPANEKSCAETADPNHCETYHADDEEYFDQIAYWKTPVSDCGDDRGDECMTYDDWVQGWTEVKG